MSSFNTPQRMSPRGTPNTRESSILERSLTTRRLAYKMKWNFIWGVVNFSLFIFFLYDIVHYCPYYSHTFHYIEFGLASLFMCSTVYHLIQYLWHLYNIQPMSLSPRQLDLLGVTDSDPFFKVTSTPKFSTPEQKIDDTPLNFSAYSWRSSPLHSTNNSFSSPNLSMSTSSWLYRGVSSLNNSELYKTSSPANTPPPPVDVPVISSVDVIDDEKALARYLRDYEKYEKSTAVVQSIEQPSNLLSSFWSHSAARTTADVSPLLRRCAYQHASPMPVLKTSSPGTPDDKGSASFHNYDVWLHVRVNPSSLTQWNSNLRKWLSQTILERIVREIDMIDESFRNHGLADMFVGGVGLERLLKTAQTPQVFQNIPSLMRLMPFLEVCSNQEYLVPRIKELSKSGCISSFQWNGGGNFNGKPWEDHLPTDSAVIMHLFTTYLDSQLPPLPLSPDGRPFTFKHFVKCPEKPTRDRHNIAIYQTQIFPPHYVVVCGDETLDVGKGPNNMFYTILLFLHLINTKEYGMLGGVNLGQSGLNLLWVIKS